MVRISDFVTPAWFRRGSRGPWDFARKTKRPLQILEDGYQLWFHQGAWDAIWAGDGAKAEGLAKARRWNGGGTATPSPLKLTTGFDSRLREERNSRWP